MSYNNIKNNDKDINQEAKRFLDELRLNTILKELTPEQREEYYAIVNSGDYEQATKFVNINIPELEDKLLERIREFLKEKKA